MQYIDSNDLHGTLPDYLNPEEIDKILDCAKTSNLSHWMILLTLWETAVREEELTYLRIEDIIPASGEYPTMIMVKKTKRGKQRNIPLSDTLVNLLTVYVDGRKKGFIFLNKYGKKLSTTAIRQFVYKYAPMAGITRFQVHPHTFRHSRAVELLKKGMTINELQHFLGHIRMETTLIYLKVLPKEMALKFNVLVN
jgi:site-specific recombinase XerD